MAKRAKSESTVRLRRIGVLSLGKVMALFGLVLGLVAGILFTLLSSIGSVPAELALMAPYGKLSIV
ncbi:MAG: hypothetical protein ABIE22_03375, partial [archaeon]